MKYLLLIVMIIFIGCATDTGVSANYDETLYSSSKTFIFDVYNSSSSIQNKIDLSITNFEIKNLYINASGIKVSVQNKLSNYISIVIDYTFNCKSWVKTHHFYLSLDSWETDEETISYVDYCKDNIGYLTITSIRPNYSSKDSYNQWNGTYTIHSN